MNLAGCSSSRTITTSPSAVAGLLVDEGYVVDQFYDGDAGLEAALRGNYDVIVLDIMLPKRSGFRVCQDLRAAGVQTPLLMLTAKEGEWDEVEGLDVGADDFLRKPFERSVLMARFHALLRRQERGRPQQLSVGAVTLDPVTRHVTRLRPHGHLDPARVFPARVPHESRELDALQG